ncbi:MAG TPA: MlaD family protein [Candidatus Eisenbacteria bacterium]|nr:MlaD family protein [Candidatus Eisenbacteria bacterium]
MRRTGKVPFMELQIGILVLVAAGLLLWATFQSSALSLSSKEKIVLRFESVGGLEEGAVVRLNGVPVGIVKEIDLREGDNGVHVTLAVKKGTRARLHQGAEARITTVGFLSELYVALESGDETAPVIASDTEIQAGIVADPQKMMGQVKGMADSLEILLGSLNKAGRGFSSGKGTLGKLSQDERLYEEMVALAKNANELAERMRVNQDRVSDRLVSLAASFDSLSWRMQHGDNTLAKMMTTDDLHRHLASSTARVDSILAVLESGKGSFGKMLSDSTLYSDTKLLMGSMKRLMSEIEKNPKKYLKFSIF